MNSPLVRKHHFEHMHMMMSGAAPIAKSDIDRFYEKYNIDSNVFKFRQGGYSQNQAVEIFDLRANEMFIEFRGSNFWGRVLTCASFEGLGYIFLPSGGRDVSKRRRDEFCICGLCEPERTSGVHIQFLTRFDESAGSILE